MSDSHSGITTRGLAKTYAGGAEALRDLDLEVAKGQIFCLLGPIGAGKTTLSRILGTQLRPTRGAARILGHDIDREARKVREVLAVVPQQSWPDQELKVCEHIFYYLVARGQRRSQAREATRRITERLGLGDKHDALVSSLSGGMRRRVLLAMAMASGAEALLLDEPTAGLDVLIRREFWDCLAALKEEEKTVLLTTHSMEEAEVLSDRVGILSDGCLVAEGTAAQLRNLAPGPQKVVLDEDALPEETLRPLGPLQRYAGKWAVFPRDQEAMRKLLDLCVQSLVETSVLHATLEDAFVHLVGASRQVKLGEFR
jgi:ABC-type multidrug transport system ATPase subunit